MYKCSSLKKLIKMLKLWAPANLTDLYLPQPVELDLPDLGQIFLHRNCSVG
jgi:hypothetical protein